MTFKIVIEMKVFQLHLLLVFLTQIKIQKSILIKYFSHTKKSLH